MSETSWYYGRNGTHSGPVATQVLAELARTGQLLGTDLVWQPGWDRWRQVHEVSSMFASGGAAALPSAQGVFNPPLATAIAPPLVSQMPLNYASNSGVNRPPEQFDAGTRWLIPVGRSGLAIAAGYMGLLSVIPFVGAGAILLSILALKDLKIHPEKHGLGRAIFGLITGCLGCCWTCAVLTGRFHR